MYEAIMLLDVIPNTTFGKQSKSHKYYDVPTIIHLKLILREMCIPLAKTVFRFKCGKNLEGMRIKVSETFVKRHQTKHTGPGFAHFSRSVSTVTGMRLGY